MIYSLVIFKEVFSMNCEVMLSLFQWTILLSHFVQIWGPSQKLRTILSIYLLLSKIPVLTLKGILNFFTLKLQRCAIYQFEIQAIKQRSDGTDSYPKETNMYWRILWFLNAFEGMAFLLNCKGTWTWSKTQLVRIRIFCCQPFVPTSLSSAGGLDGPSTPCTFF